MQTVSFFHFRDGSMRCRETGDTYAVEFFRGLRDGFAVSLNGSHECLQPSRRHALGYIESHARLEFLSRQAETGAYAA